MIYLDNAGTTAPTEECIKDFNDIVKEFGNPSSDATELGAKTKRIIEEAQDIINEFIGGKDIGRVYFTSSGSEANTWAIRGIIDKYKIKTIITTEIEHSSTYNCIKFMESQGCNVIYIPVDEDGLIDDEIYYKACVNNPNSLVSIMYVNNEVGFSQDMYFITDVAHQNGCIVHSDCVQAFGYSYLDVNGMHIDIITGSAHKIGCFKGIGFLYINNEVNISPLIFGGKQMDGLRGGTENVPYIYCFGQAVKRIENKYTVWDKLIERGLFLERQLRGFNINYRINCDEHHGHKIYSILLKDLAFSDVTAADIMNVLANEHDIYIAVGSACTSGYDKPSRVLKAIGLSDKDARDTIRVSITDKTEPYNIYKFVKALKEELDILAPVELLK